MAKSGKPKKQKAYRRTPTVFQMEQAESGAACIAMLLSYYGKETSLEQLRLDTQMSCEGCTLEGMEKAAKKHRLKAEFFADNPEFLTEEAQAPCILKTGTNRYVVYEGKKGKKNRRYYVNDPAVGRRKLTEEQFISLYDGITIQLAPRKSFRRTKRSLLSMMRDRMKGETAVILSLFLIALLLAATGVAIPFFAALFIDGVLIGKTVTWFYTFLGVLAIILGFWIFFTVMKKNILLKLKNKRTVLSDYRLFQHLVRLPFSFWEQRGLAFYGNRVEKNAQVSRFLTEDFIEMLLDAFSALFCLLLIGNYSRKLMLVSVCAIAVYGLLPLPFYKSIALLAQKAEQRNGRLKEAVYDGVEAAASLKAAGAENDYVSRIMGYLTGSLESEQRTERLQRVLDVFVMTGRDIAGVVVLMLGAGMTAEGTLSVGQLVSCVMLTAIVLKAGGEFLTQFTGLSLLKNDMKRIDDIWRFREEKEGFWTPKVPEVEEPLEDSGEESTEADVWNESEEEFEDGDAFEEAEDEDAREEEVAGSEEENESEEESVDGDVSEKESKEEASEEKDEETDRCLDRTDKEDGVEIRKISVQLEKRTDSFIKKMCEETEKTAQTESEVSKTTVQLEKQAEASENEECDETGETDQEAETDENGEESLEEMLVEEEPPITALTGVLQLENVSYGYHPAQKEKVQEISFSAKAGEMIAIVGKAGSGKSTVLNLISGLYAPWSGEITYDGKQLFEIPREVFYRDIAVVGQHAKLFAGSIRENITLWDTSVTEADMIKAAKDACIHDVIMKKKEAYDYVLLENGKNLSEGEKQRLEIAAALAKNPSLLILDEATAKLDVLTEQKVIANIRKRGCSCILAVHRPSVIRSCDRIVVFEKGQIVQSGTHKELARARGVYRKLLQNI